MDRNFYQTLKFNAVVRVQEKVTFPLKVGKKKMVSQIEEIAEL